MKVQRYVALLTAAQLVAALPQYDGDNSNDDSDDPNKPYDPNNPYGFLNDLGSGLGSLLGNAVGTLGGVGGGILGGLGSIGSSFGSALSGLGNDVGDAAGDLTDSLGLGPIGGYLTPLFNPARIIEERRRANEVKNVFRFAWQGYSKYAFPNDELHPLDNTWGNSRNGWGASAVDALSTAIIMRQGDIVNQILDFIPKIDFTQSKDNAPVSLFETTIRYLGGMVSAYDLLHTGSFSRLARNQNNVQALLTQSVNLANRLKFAFHLGDATNNCSLPYNDLIFSTNSAMVKSSAQTNNLAQAGSLVLEWTRLSDLTRNPEYYQLASKAMEPLLFPKPPAGQPQTAAEPFPGLLGQDIYVTGPDACKFATNSGGWGGGDDSFYEYLIKSYAYDRNRFGFYKERWLKAVESAMKYLASHPEPAPGQPANWPKNLTFLAVFNGQDVSSGKYSQHLTCFDGGNFILGGQILRRKDIIDFGLKLVDSCYQTYRTTMTGIGPEAFSWDEKRVPADQLDFYNKNGFWITSGAYILRPEVLESIYYAYRLTRNPKYQDWAWDAFVNINQTARVPSGFAGLGNVNAKGGGDKINNQESFFFAEVMKYAYMIHAPDEQWQAFGAPGKRNQFVFNTEAHPMRVAGPPL